MLGPDGVGKTFLLYKLKTNADFPISMPTIGFNLETIKHKTHKFDVWDIGGLEKLLPLWKHYLLNVTGIIFVINGSMGEKRSYFIELFQRMIQDYR